MLATSSILLLTEKWKAFERMIHHDSLMELHNITSAGLFLMLGFKLEDSASRWWDARTTWQDINSGIHFLVSDFMMNMPDMELREKLLRYLVAYPFELKSTLRCENFHYEEVERLLPSQEVAKSQMKAPEKYILRQVRFLHKNYLTENEYPENKDPTIPDELILSVNNAAGVCYKFFTLPLSLLKQLGPFKKNQMMTDVDSNATPETNQE